MMDSLLVTATRLACLAMWWRWNLLSASLRVHRPRYLVTTAASEGKEGKKPKKDQEKGKQGSRKEVVY